MKKPGRAGRAATGVAAIALTASAVLVGIAGSAAATTGPPPTTTPVMASHARTSVPGRTEVTATSGFNSKNVKRLTRDCPAGTQSAGGGFFTAAAGNAVADDLNLTPPQAETNAYEDQPYALNWTLRTSVICA